MKIMANRRLQIGDRVKVFHETNKDVCYGLGTIENIGYYFGLTIAYYVRLDNFPANIGDYARRQLKKVKI